MEPMIMVKSMEVAAKLLCCAQQNPAGNGGIFPSTPPGQESKEGDSWDSFLEAFFELSIRIAEQAMHG